MGMTIRGLVYSRFKSVREFSRAVGWNRQKANLIVNCKQVPTVTDVNEMASALGVSVADVTNIFLGEKSQKCD